MGVIETFILEIFKNNLGLGIILICVYFWHKVVAKKRQDELKDMENRLNKTLKDNLTALSGAVVDLLREHKRDMVQTGKDRDSKVNDLASTINNLVDNLTTMNRDHDHKTDLITSDLKTYFQRELDQHKVDTDKTFDNAIREFEKTLNDVYSNVKDMKRLYRQIADIMITLPTRVDDKVIRSAIGGGFRGEID